VSATRTVYKYALAGGKGAPIDVSMPEGAEVLSAGSQTGDDILAWAKVDPAAPSEKRGEVLRFREGFVVVDDSYNSNPRSLLSMAEAVAGGGEGVTRRVVVAGEMLELGEEGAALHREAGRDIAGFGVDILWGVRGLARELVEGARESGMTEASTRFFEDSEEAAEALVEFVRPGDLVLVKGSRGVHTEQVVEALKERYEQSVNREP
jgi:UDP-N-acetylmuramoyl-tripeptide--D-alanyl-D-alanine ligase